MVTILIALYILAGLGTTALFCYDNRVESYIGVLMLVTVFFLWLLVLFVMLAEHLDAATPSVRNPFWHRGTP